MNGMNKLDSKGFTLVEIMIAMFILTIGIMGVTGMFLTTIKGNAFARNTSIANRLAQNIMEQMKTQAVESALNDLCTDPPGTPPPDPPWLTCDKTVANTVTGKYQDSSIDMALGGDMNTTIYNVSVIQTPDSPISGVDTVSLTITWQDGYGSHTTRVVTLIES